MKIVNKPVHLGKVYLFYENVKITQNNKVYILLLFGGKYGD